MACRRVLRTLLVLVMALAGMAVAGDPAGAATVSRKGCTLTFPNPRISSSGTASMSFSVRCSTRPLTNVRVEMKLRADDGPFDHDITSHATTLRSGGSGSWSNLRCNEDAGRDEIYVRARIIVDEVYASSWVDTSTISGYCSGSLVVF